MPSPIVTRLRRLDPVVSGAVIVGIAIRCAALVAKLGDPIPFSDATWYSGQARALWQGKGFNDLVTGEPTAEHGPLTSILLAPFSWSDATEYQRVAMTVLGIAGLVMIAILAWRLLSPTAARIAVVIAAVYPNIWVHNPIVMSETVATLLIAVAMWLLLRLRTAVTWPRALALGVVIGLAALARSELALLAPLMGGVAAWFAHRQARDAPRPWAARPVATFAIVAAAAVTVVSPWVLANLTRFEEPVTMTTNDGTTWLGANCDDTYEGPILGGWSLVCVFDEEVPEDVDPAVRSRLWREAAFEYVGDNTGRVPVVVTARVGRMLGVYTPDSMVRADAYEDKIEWALWVGTFMWWVLAPLAVLGLVVMPRTDRWILLPPILIVSLTTVVFYGGIRLRNPLELSVVLAAAYGATWLVRRPRAARSTEPATAGATADEPSGHPAPAADSLAR